MKIILKHLKGLTYNIIIIICQTCTAGIHAHFYMFIKLNPTKTKVLTYISRLHAIIIIITSFKPKSNMNHHLSSTWNIIYIYISIQPDYYQEHIHDKHLDDVPDVATNLYSMHYLNLNRIYSKSLPTAGYKFYFYLLRNDVLD